MTRENSDHDKDNPATNPKRENGQGKHDGASHEPDEFDVMNPVRQRAADENEKPGAVRP